MLCGTAVIRVWLIHSYSGLPDRVARLQVRSLGAVPFVRTNVPQCLMLPESFNAIWGTSCNPHDKARLPAVHTHAHAHARARARARARTRARTRARMVMFV